MRVRARLVTMFNLCRSMLALPGRPRRSLSPAAPLTPLRGLVTAVAVAAALATCAAPRGGAGSDGRPVESARRSSACRLTVFHTATPPLAKGSWDDLGVAEVLCHIDVGFAVCRQRFRAEACRMGGDILYDVPDEPLRPREQTVMFRGRVARIRAAAAPVPAPARPPTTALAPAPPSPVTRPPVVVATPSASARDAGNADASPTDTTAAD